MNENIEQLITNIEQEFDTGLMVYLQKKDLTLLSLPDEAQFGFIDDEDWEKAQTEIENNPENYFELDKWDSSYSFKIMNFFVENIDDNAILKAKLSEVLEREKPFKNFRTILDHHEKYLQEWYKFKTLKQKEFIKNQLIALKILE